MKKLFLSTLALFCIVLLSAQTLPYPTDTIRGKVYYRYTVKQGEGLYRISKNFGVSQEDIVKANPELEKRGLRLGQTIKVPLVQEIDSTKYILHTLQPKETLYRLSKKYGVSIADIQALNPETSKRMAIGTTLMIPRKGQGTENREERTEKRAEVAQPILDLGKLFGQPMDTLATDSLVADTIIPQPTLRIAYLLPLMTNQAKRTPAVDRFLEFYEGALLAIYDAQREGQRLEIFVYDTEKNDIRIQTILQQPEMQTMHAIIGPAYPSQISHVSKFAYAHQIPTLIPFTNKVADIDINPYLWQFNPSVESEMDTLIAYTQKTYPAANYIFIETDTDKPSASVTIFKQHLASQEVSLQTIPATVILNDSLGYSLQAEKENILIFDTEKIAQLPLLLDKVRSLNKTYSITLFSHYGWQDELLPVGSFYTSVFNKSKLIDLQLAAYHLKFKHFFGHAIESERPRYDLLGYDLTTYMIQMLQSNAPCTIYQGLQSDVLFKQVNDRGGYENTCIQIMTK